MRSQHITRLALLLLAGGLALIAFPEVSSARAAASDTVYVAMNDSARVPGMVSDIMDNIRTMEPTFQILNEKLGFIRKANFASNKPPKPTGQRGVTYVFYVWDAFERPGTYIVKRIYKVTDELGKKEFSAQTPVKVIVPTLVSSAPTDADSNCYYGQSVSFSFATREFRNPRLYSYTIVVRNAREEIQLPSTPGASFVSLDTLLTKPENVGGTITVDCRYNGKPFDYYDPLDAAGKLHRSQWMFFVKGPSLERVTFWTQRGKPYEKGQYVLNMSLTSIFNPKEFRYTYSSKVGNSYIYTTPRVTGFRFVGAEPDGFLMAGDVEMDYNNVWLVVRIKPRKTFMDAIDPCKYRDVTVRFSFTTQFGETISDEYQASIVPY